MQTRMIFGFLVVFVVASCTLRAEDALDAAKKVYEAAVKKADDTVAATQKKADEDKAKAKTVLIKAYEEAIKRITQKGDLEAANALVAEKKVLEGGEAVENHLSKKPEQGDLLGELTPISLPMAQALVQKAKGSLSQDEWDKIPGKIYKVGVRDVCSTKLELVPGFYAIIASPDDTYEVQGVKKVYKINKFLRIKTYDKDGGIIKDALITENPIIEINARVTQAVLAGHLGFDGGDIRVKVSRVK
jgi:hypothetical protein